MGAGQKSAAESSFSGRAALVTGGLGFIGSALALALSEAGARVTVVDSLSAGDGGNRENLKDAHGIEVVIADIGDKLSTQPLVERSDIVFNLSGKVSHIDSVNDPLADLHANTISQLAFLEVCRRIKPEIPIVHTSTRQIYGKAETGSVDEDSPIRPIDPNGISKFAADAYHRMFARDFGMKTAVLRLTNTFGPRQLLAHNRQGFIPWFIRTAMTGSEITIYGDGRQTRDILYVDDAVDALLMVAELPELNGQVFNIGSPFIHSVGEVAELAVELAGTGSLRLVPFPEEKKRIDVGSVACDYSAMTSATGWIPKINLRDGLARTIEYFRPRLAAYL
ncbi:MAG: NAD-dependent epimerase/dehydratase family protein [Myxococcales bacterium]